MTEHPTCTAEDLLLPGRFLAQAAAQPGRLAIVAGERRLTYGELAQAAGHVAHALAARGAGPEVRVALALEDGLDMVVGILGVLQAGAAFVPLDLRLPLERLDLLLEDSGAALLLLSPAAEGRLPGRPGVVTIDLGAALQAEGEPPSCPADQESLAYVLYTSGSTGRPNGVEITHRALCASFTARARFYPVPPASWLQPWSFAFDGALVGLFWMLSTGGALVLPPPGAARDPAELGRLITAHQIRAMGLLPSLYALLLERPERLATLETVVVAGEPCLPFLVDRHHALMPGTALVNEYGPTESTIWAAAHHTAPDPRGGPVPIGRAIPGTECLLADEQGTLVEGAGQGTLLLAGPHLARGYLGRPELSARRFRALEVPGRGALRVYDTGDRVRRDEAGLLYYLGRADQQVKLRGHRVELGEVEAGLLAHGSVGQAAVLAREDAYGERRLVAYYVARAERPVRGAELRAFLRERLPEYMVPAVFVPLAAMPLTAGGKIDRLALPSGSGEERERTTPYVAPRDALEACLAQVWTEILGVEPIGIHDDFFELGGSSLSAIRALARVHQETGKSLSLVKLFHAPTIAQLGASLAAEKPARSSEVLEVIHPAGGEAPLLFVGSVAYARMLAAHLDGQRPVYGLNLFGLELAEGTAELDVRRVAAGFLAEARAYVPGRRYCLVAYCDDSVVAFEMAQQVRRDGGEVPVLAFIDAVWDEESPGGLLGAAGRTARRVLDNTLSLGPAYLRHVLRRRLRYARETADLLWARGQRRLRSSFGLDLDLALRHKHRVSLYMEAVRRYRPEPYAGVIDLFLSTEARAKRPRALGALAQVRDHDVPGYHDALFRSPSVEALASRLSALCAGAPAGPQPRA